jgi:hypothetical protein
MQYRSKPAPGLRCWLDQLMAGTHQNVAIVALANKLVRMAWAVLSKNETYRHDADVLPFPSRLYSRTVLAIQGSLRRAKPARPGRLRAVPKIAYKKEREPMQTAWSV